jgi:hypothetical protein
MKINRPCSCSVILFTGTRAVGRRTLLQILSLYIYDRLHFSSSISSRLKLMASGLCFQLCSAIPIVQMY